MAVKTYTILVTIDDDDLPTPEVLAAHVSNALNRGSVSWDPFDSAEVDAFEGDQTKTPRATWPGDREHNTNSYLATAKSVHRNLRGLGIHR